MQKLTFKNLNQKIMKTIVNLLLAVLLTTPLFSQNIIDKHFEAYKSQENFTAVNVSAKMFELAGYIEFDENDKELSELKEFIGTVEAFNLIAGREVADPVAKYTSAIKKVASSHEELMNVQDNGDRFTFFIDESKGVVRELVMVGTTNQELFIASITGRMNLRDLSRMANKIQTSGFSHMKMLDDKGAADLKVFPNPTVVGSDMTLQMPEHLIGGKATLYNMNGQAVQTVDIVNREQQLTTKGVAVGSYVLELQHDGVSMKKRVVIQSK
jgi:hypothetical protein